VDNVEEAIRKNVLTQTNRFLSAGNRQGATFQMGHNFLSDRLDAELHNLLGVVLDDEHFPAEKFPHSRAGLRELADELPAEFDWRPRGAVSPVRCTDVFTSCFCFIIDDAPNLFIVFAVGAA
jgi:C1A family cysteine protease